MKFTSIFFTASAVYIRAKRKLYTNEREIYEVYFNIFHSECSLYSRKAQITYKRAKNIKLALLFQSERRLYSRKAQIINKREKNIKLASIFLQRDIQSIL